MSFNQVYIVRSSCLTPAGIGVEDVWKSLLSPRTEIDCGLGSLPANVDSNLLRLKTEKSLKDQDRLTLLGVSLARSMGPFPKSMGLILGSSRGATQSLEKSIEAFLKGERLKASTSPVTTGSGLTAAVARDLSLEGPAFYLSAACSTGVFSIIQGFANLRADILSHVLVGGVEAANTAFTKAIMNATGVTSSSREAFPCRPMADGREGMVLSEGAAFLLLSTERQNSSFAIASVGAATEAASLTGVSSEGLALQEAVRTALERADILPKDIGLVVGHGAGTLKGDASELEAYRGIFGSDGIPPLVFHKWCLGHMLGASSALSVILATKHLETGFTSPHPYLPEAHPLALSTRLRSNKYALITSMGFGGSACAVVVKNLKA